MKAVFNPNATNNDINRAASEFYNGGYRSMWVNGNMSRRAMRRQLEKMGMTKDQADKYLTDIGMPGQKPARRG
ncbi:MAG: Heat induced stress protein YflT [Marinobacter excellens HL-55]|uniref:Heat induced stress protein YflT n=1 Tax=Marinobacter excellens HL-55 TaxID=1305731 RepID=A0A0P8D1H2_9GAMM|nr:MAG: Heat induced stress protein YflT [Marinobacter excellens HL-55]